MNHKPNRSVYSKQTTLMVVDAEQTRTVSVNTRLLELFKPIVIGTMIAIVFFLLLIFLLIWYSWQQNIDIKNARAKQHLAQDEVKQMRQEIVHLQNMTSKAVQTKLEKLKESEQSVDLLQNYLQERGVPIPLKPSQQIDNQQINSQQIDNMTHEQTKTATTPPISPHSADNKHLVNKVHSNGSAHIDSKFTQITPISKENQIKIRALSPIPYTNGYSSHIRKLLKVAQKVPIGYPHAGQISSRYGYRNNPFGTGAREFHHGLDFRGKTGEPIYSTADGEVILAGRQNGYGLVVKIKHGYGYSTTYAHLSKIHVKPHDVISANTIIGELGSTGRSTGPHLHYEVRHHNRRLDPEGFLTLDAPPPKMTI